MRNAGGKRGELVAGCKKDIVISKRMLETPGRTTIYGWMLADTVIARARFLGARRIYLVTQNASDFFAAKHGFRVVDLSTVSPAVANSVTFRNQRGRTSIAMRLDL